jgi:hypothetical protein
MHVKVLIIALWCTASQAIAQNSQWSAGIGSLLGRARFTYGDAPSDYEDQLGVHAGGFARWQTKGRVAIRMGLSYACARAGYRGQYPDITFPGIPPIKGDRYEKKFEQSDLLIPVEMEIDLGKKDQKGVYLLLGTAIDLVLTQKAGFVNFDSGMDEELVLRPVSDYRKVDLLGSLGVGYAFQLGNGYQLFIQPSLYNNIPGNVLHFLSQKKGDQSSHKTIYWYGLSVGGVKRF